MSAWASKAPEVRAYADAAGKKAIDGVDVAPLPGCMRRLDEVALLAMATTLRDGGAFADGTEHGGDAVSDLLRVASRHRWIVRRWIEVLTAEGWLTEGPDGCYRDLRPVERAELVVAAGRELQEAGHGLGYPAEMTRFFRAAIDHLPELLRDEVPLQALLFPDGELATAEGAYKDNIINRYVNAATAAVLHQLARHRGPCPLRVLELGAGIGGTTTDVLDALLGLPVEYLFTDVSRFFLVSARERFAGKHSLRYALFDINGDPTEQGVPVGSQDVVLGANVAHNAVHVGRFLRGMRDLLAPGGVLVLVESCREHYQAMTSMQFLMSARPGSTPVGRSDVRAGTDRIFLTRRDWLTEFEDAGFTPLLDLPDPDQPLAALAQHVFVAGR